MNVLVIGASGRVGGKLVEALLKEGHKVTGSTRQEKKLFKDANYRQIYIELTNLLSEIEKGIPDDTEAIYFVSGSGGKDVLKVDLHGAVKTMQAAENKGIKRYIMLSAIHSLEPDKWVVIKDYFTGKYFADEWLIHRTSLDYTIMQPGTLNEESGSGKIKVGVDERGKVAIDNVAEALKEVLNRENTFGKTIPMLDGETPVADAIAQV